MKVKHFHIRLNKENLQQDLDTLNEFMQGVVIKNAVPQLITLGQISYWSVLVFYDDTSTIESLAGISSEKQPKFDPSTLTTEEKLRYDALRTWRFDAAAKDNFPAYVVASNAQLGAIATLNPITTEELLKIKGFGEKRTAKYGNEIIAVLNSI